MDPPPGRREAALGHALRELRDVGCVRLEGSAGAAGEVLAEVVVERLLRAVQTLDSDGKQRGDGLLRAAGCRFKYDAAHSASKWEASEEPVNGDAVLYCDGARYRLHRCAGFGQYGAVVLCGAEGGVPVAVKLHYDCLGNPTALRHYHSELRTLAALSGSPVTPRFISASSTFGVPCVITDVAPGYTLDSLKFKAAIQEAETQRACVLVIACVEGLCEAFAELDSACVSCWDAGPRNVLFDPVSLRVSIVDFGEAKPFHRWRGAAPPSSPDAPPPHPLTLAGGIGELSEELGRHGNEHALRGCIQQVGQVCEGAPLPVQLSTALAAVLTMHDRATSRRPGAEETGPPTPDSMAALSQPLTVAAITGAWRRVWPGGVSQAERVARSAAARTDPPNPDRDTVFDTLEGSVKLSAEEAALCDELAELRGRCKAVSLRLSRRAGAAAK